MMKKTIMMITICVFTICSENFLKSITNNSTSDDTEIEKIQVLNFATFHMGSTVDATSIEFDETNKKNREEANRIAAMIAKFKPTIICVERPSDEDGQLNEAYQKYLLNEKELGKYSGEIGLLAFEVGRIAEVPRLYGIDYEMSYNYNIGNEIKNTLDSTTISTFYANPFKDYPELAVNPDELSLIEKLKLGNTSEALDFLMLVNADILTYVGTGNGYEGADEAAKYYERNLKIYSNLNRIPATKADRIFILSGGSHAAFLKEFIERSPKYEMVLTLDYLD